MEHNNIGDKKSLDLALVLTAITNEPLQQGMQKICLDKHSTKSAWNIVYMSTITNMI
jgi:hypothetical protein